MKHVPLDTGQLCVNAAKAKIGQQPDPNGLGNDPLGAVDINSAGRVAL
jgi:hypothetical protein